jgi:ASPIC and UnbV/FG-GAP-like repeat
MEIQKMRELLTRRLAHRTGSILLTVLLIDAALTSASAQIAFEDVSVAAGFANTASETWGAAWGDLDGDHYPDLFSSNHRTRATLFHNNQNGTFTEVSKQVDLSKTPGWTGGRSDVDTHGAVWGDVNNDGQEDLIEAVSSSTDHLWINNGGKLTLSTTAYGVDKISTRSKRQILFFDYNGDGLLDLASIGLRGSSFSPQLQNATFGTGNPYSQSMACSSEGEWGHISDVNPNTGFDVICGPRNGTYPKVNSFAGGVASDVSSQFTQYSPIVDAATLDYDGDLQPDLFLLRSSERPSDAYQYSPTGFEMQIITAANKTKSVTFQSTGILSLSVSLRSGLNSADPQYEGDPNYIFIGSSNYHPSSLTFQLDPADPNNAGVLTGSTGINIGYSPDTGTWTISQGNTVYNYSYVQVTSTLPISGLTFYGASGSDIGYKPILLHNTGTGFTQVLNAGFNSQARCQSVVSGDFDNDMHEDLFLACTGGSHNMANRLFRNNGNGTFTEIPNAGGAAGLIGAAVAEHAGTSETVVVADYDLDGFLDLLVTNGDNMRPLYLGGPKQLFHNLGNTNSWVEFDLVGTTSNRDGIGSKVYVKTADGVTQYREQNGGYHKWSQNFMRVHFGLATNTAVDTTTVVWPDGTPTTYTGLAADHIYQLKQDGTYTQIH